MGAPRGRSDSRPPPIGSRPRPSSRFSPGRDYRRSPDYTADRGYRAPPPDHGSRRASPDYARDRGGRRVSPDHALDRGGRRASPDYALERGGQRQLPRYDAGRADSRDFDRGDFSHDDRGGKGNRRPTQGRGRDHGRSGSRPCQGRRSPSYGRSPSRDRYQERRDSRERGPDRGRGQGDGESTETLELPRRMMGKVIGKQGAQIKAIRAQTQANIQVEETRGGDKCEFTIRGDLRQIREAKNMILDIVENEQGDSQNNDANGRGGGGDRQGSERREEMEVPPSLMGRIIGKGGETVKQLQQDSGAKIDIRTKEQPDIVHLSGSPDAIARAKAMIDDIIARGRQDSRQDGPDPQRSAKPEEIMEVPGNQIGRIIGKGGEMIMQLQGDSGAKIDIMKDRQGCVRLSGSQEAIEHAKRLIWDLMDRADARDGDGQSNEAPRHSSKVEETMEVPTNMTGRIIGKGGEMIQQLQKDSGAKIQMDKDQPGIVRLSGARGDVDYARQLISDLVNRDDGRNSGSRANDNRGYGSYQQPSKLEESMTVPQSMMGRIIGKGGEKIMQLQQESGAKLDISKDLPGIVKLSGSSESISHAKRLIEEIIEGGGKGGGKSAERGPQSNETMEIQHNMVQHVVGNDGSKVKVVEERSGARIDVDTREGTFKLHISGPRHAVESAQSMIYDTMERANASDSGSSFPPPPPMPPRDQGWTENGRWDASGWQQGSTWNGHETAWSGQGSSSNMSGGTPWQSTEQMTGTQMPTAAPMFPMPGTGHFPHDSQKQKRKRSSSSSSSSSQARKKQKKGREQSGAQSAWPQDPSAVAQSAWAAQYSAWAGHGAYPAQMPAGETVSNQIDMDEL